MNGLIPIDEIKRLQNRMNRLLEELDLSELQSRSLEEIQRLQERMARLLEESEKVPVVQPSAEVQAPATDIVETDEELIVRLDLPGIDKGNVEVTVSEGELSVKATRGEVKEEKGEKYYKRERTYRRFERMLKLPVDVKDEVAKAKLENGMLEVRMPKVEVSPKRRIEIV
jgi:HSP20 family protein